MARRVSSSRFVGRSSELERLRSTLLRAAGGRAAVVVIGGEAGVGKSRLVDEFTRSLDPDRTRSLVGYCIDIGNGSAPYAPFVEAFRSLAAGRSSAELDRLLGPGRARLATLVPQLAADLAAGSFRHDDGAASQGAFYEHLLGTLGRLASDRPLVLVLEDLHWADASTRDLVRFLTRNLRSEPLLLVLTYRSDDLHRRHPLLALLAELDRLDVVERVTIEPFGAEDLRALLEGILGWAPDGAVVGRVLERSDGNAFFAEELVAAGVVDDVAGLPDTVREIVGSRVARLDHEGRAVLRTASVIGRRVPHWLLAEACRLPADDLVAGIREAVAAQLLVAQDNLEGAVYEFRHALVQEAVLDELLPAERTEAHAVVARLLEAGYAATAGMATEIARHWYLAHDLPMALRSAIRAGDDAAALIAFAEAHAQYEVAVELWPAVADPMAVAACDEAALLARAADAAALSGDLARAIALADRALALLHGDEERVRRLELTHRVTLYRWDLGDADGAAMLVQRALAEAAGAPAPIRARLLSDLCRIHWNARRYPETRDVAERAVEVADDAGDPVEQAHARMWLGTAMGELGQLGAGIAVVDEALRLVEDGPAELRLECVVVLTHLLYFAGLAHRAIEVGLLELERARSAGVLARQGPYLLANISEAQVDIGRYADAQRLIDEGTWPRGGNRASLWLHEQSVEISIARGDLARAEEQMAAARESIGAVTASIDSLWFLWAEGLLAQAEGRHLEARGHFEAAIAQSDDPTRDVALQYVLVPALANEADLAADALRRDDPAAHAEARRLGNRLAGLLEANIANMDAAGLEASREAKLARAAAERTRVDGPPHPDAWERMAMTAGAIGRLPDEALGRFREAEALLTIGVDRQRATRSLRQAARIAREIGGAPLLAQVEQLARRARIDLQADPDTLDPAPVISSRPPVRFGLTSRELEVLAHVAEGRTNREIGSALFISEKTASVHVTHILDKLGVGSRVEAAIAAERLGILASDDATGREAQVWAAPRRRRCR